MRGMWDLSRPGIKPVSPALAGRFLMTVPPGKSPCLVIFDWMLVVVNFTLLGARYFFIPTNILEICSGMQLSYLEIVCSLDLLVWILGFARQCLSNIYSRVINPHH